MSFVRNLAAAAAAAALMGCAPRAVVVRSEGWAAEDAAHPGTASRRATADALRRAVETVSGVRLAARTQVRNGAAVSERVTAVATGCVLGYSLVSDRPAEGGRAVRIRARVSHAAKDCGGPPPGLGARVSVYYEGKGVDSREAGRAAAEALGGELALRGWEVVSGPAPLMVVVSATAIAASDPRVAPLMGSRVELDVRVETSAGRILGHSLARAAAADVDARSATRRAARTAAGKAADSAASSLTGGFWAAAFAD
jgi:hypothetical protein